MANETKQELILKGRTFLTLNAVDEVLSFDDTVINLSVGGVTFSVYGTGLSIINLSVENGNISISGKIDSLIYTDEAPEKRSFFSRFFS